MPTKDHIRVAAVSGGIGATIIVLIMAKVQRATAVASPCEIRNHVDPDICTLFQAHNLLLGLSQARGSTGGVLFTTS